MIVTMDLVEERMVREARRYPSPVCGRWPHACDGCAADQLLGSLRRNLSERAGINVAFLDVGRTTDVPMVVWTGELLFFYLVW